MRHAAILTFLLATVAHAQDLSIAALRIGAPDMAKTAAFYERHLGFTREYEGDYILLMNDDDYLVITQGEMALAHSESCHARLNFLVPDLDGAVASLKAAGATFVSEDRSAVGRYATFTDPAMHRFNIKQLDQPVEGLDGPRLFNVGISVFDMDGAVEFYEETLGFTVRTKDYYPPVVVFEAAGPAYFILSDRTVTAPSTYTDSYFTGLAFETADIESAMRDLAAKGVVFVDETPEVAGDVLHVTFRDPFGNIHELIEYVGMPTIDDLAMLEGHWLFEFPGGTLEEVWFGVAGDNMTGTMRQVHNGELNLVETFTITQGEDGVLTYRLRHFDGALTPWDSEVDGPLTGVVESAGDGRVVIRIEGDQLDSIVYELEGDTLTASVVFPEGRDPFVLTFERQ